MLLEFRVFCCLFLQPSGLSLCGHSVVSWFCLGLLLYILLFTWLFLGLVLVFNVMEVLLLD